MTPRFIYVWIENIEKCPYSPCDPPDEGYLLIQEDFDPCIWSYANDCFTIIFQIFSTYCTFWVYYVAPYWRFFKSGNQPLGTKFFESVYDYCDGSVLYGKFGKARFYSWSI